MASTWASLPHVRLSSLGVVCDVSEPPSVILSYVSPQNTANKSSWYTCGPCQSESVVCPLLVSWRWSREPMCAFFIYLSNFL